MQNNHFTKPNTILKKQKDSKLGIKLCIVGKNIKILNVSGNGGKETFVSDGYVGPLNVMTVSQVHTYIKIYQTVGFMYIYYISILIQ